MDDRDPSHKSFLYIVITLIDSSFSKICNWRVISDVYKLENCSSLSHKKSTSGKLFWLTWLTVLFQLYLTIPDYAYIVEAWNWISHREQLTEATIPVARLRGRIVLLCVQKSVFTRNACLRASAVKSYAWRPETRSNNIIEDKIGTLLRIVRDTLSHQYV